MPSALNAVSQVRRHLLIHRRGLAALAAGVAVWAAVTAVRPPEPPHATVWVAVRDLSSGTVLHADDLRAVPVPADSVPRAAHDLATLDGRILAAPVGAGEVATATRLLGNPQLVGYPGRSAVPLRVPDADAAGLLRAGDRVDLVASDPQQPRHGTRIATDVVVLAVPPPASGSNATGLDGRLVVFAVPSDEAVDIAAAAAGLFLNVIWNR
ncbi:MAG: SAF domain-containing protein [Propionibacteriales bacterium]|nr:SAF domain-containing protein [Propionibacteriales bacterium]